MQEKRISPRYEIGGECDVKVLYTREDPRSRATHTLKAQIKNASVGGLCIKTQEPFREGDLADCDFRLKGDKKGSSLGLVKWCSPDKGVGIEFFHGSEEQRDNLQKDLRGALE